MTRRTVVRMVEATAWLLGATTAAAQQQPPIRQIGALEHVTPDSLGLESVSIALAMPGGHVMINDVRGRRVLLLDSTLARGTVVADTTSATAEAYGSSWATLTRYRGDTALLMVPSTLSMFVIGPTGKVARVMAIPRPDDAQLVAGVWGLPGFDARGRLVYFGGLNVLPGIMVLTKGMPLLQDGKPTAIAQQLEAHAGNFWIGRRRFDSSIVVRVDPASHALDTAAWVRIPRYERDIKVDQSGDLTAIETTPDPLPLVDQWALLRDGTLAVVRGRDFHIDWIDGSDHTTSTAKLPFDWKRVDDARKQTLIDSAVDVWQKQFDEVAAKRSGSGGGAGGNGGRGGSTGGRGGGGGGGQGGPHEPAPMIAARPALSDLPDYVPPFGEHSVTTDLDDNLWIQTSETAGDRPVYLVVNRHGVLVDRVQLPAFRTIAGFGPGVIYMAVTDKSGAVRLERARLR